MATIRKVPEGAARALARLQAELSAVDKAVAEVEAKMENVADHFRDAEREVTTLYDQWQAAQEAMEQEVSFRGRAEAIRKVIRKITVTFEPTGQKKPLGRVKAVKIEAHGPDVFREGDLRPCESEFRFAVAQVFRRRYVYDLAGRRLALQAQQIQTARARYRRNAAIWRQKQRQRRNSKF